MCSWTPHAQKTSTFLNHWGPMLISIMCEWQCECLCKLLRMCASFLSLSSCRARPERCLNLWIRSFQQLWHFSYLTFWASLKQSANDAECKDLEHEYMSLCTQIYILEMIQCDNIMISIMCIFTLTLWVHTFCNVKRPHCHVRLLPGGPTNFGD